MLTITEFSSVQLKAAQAILADPRHKAEEAPPAAEAVAAAPDPAEEVAAAAAKGDEEAQAEAEAVVVAVEAAAGAKKAPEADAEPGEKPAKKGAPPGPSEAAIAAVAEALSVKEEKVGFLVEAVGLVGHRMDRIKMVRVVQLEGAPQAAIKKEKAAYLLDMKPSPQPQRRSGGDDARDKGKHGRGKRPGGGKGRGGEGGDSRGRPGRPGAGGPRDGGKGPGGGAPRAPKPQGPAR